jgi:3-oxoacyl-[acyl-carrier-protein] synthase II
LGNSPQAMWDAMLAGRSGVAKLASLPPLEGHVVYGGEARQFSGHIDDFGPLEKSVQKSIRKALKMMCRESMMAVAAAQQAIVDAGYAETPMDPERSGVVFGSDYMLSPPEDFQDGMEKCGTKDGGLRYSEWGDAGLGEMNPLWMLKYLPNMPASHIAIFNDLRGPNNSLTLREASSLAAVAEAVHTIQRGHADRMVAGATGTRIHSFKTIHALQTEQLANVEAPPESASRPFDRDRTGMVVGEGAGAIVIEELGSARSRSATIYGEIVGTGSSSVVGDGAVGVRSAAMSNAIRAALTSADASPDSVGHISADGMSTTQGDIQESRSLVDVFGPRAADKPVLAAKSYFGNLGAGSGMVELAASLLAQRSGRLPVTLNYATADPVCPIAVVHEASLPAGGSFLTLNATPQGQAAALLVAACD